MNKTPLKITGEPLVVEVKSIADLLALKKLNPNPSRRTIRQAARFLLEPKEKVECLRSNWGGNVYL